MRNLASSQSFINWREITRRWGILSHQLYTGPRNREKKGSFGQR